MRHLHKYKQLIVILLLAFTSICMISGCNKNTNGEQITNIENSEVNTDTSSESIQIIDGNSTVAILKDDFYYSMDEDKIISYSGEDAQVSNAYYNIPAGNNKENWSTLYGDKAISQLDSGITKYTPSENSEITEYGYLIYSNEFIEVYLNNFLRGPNYGISGTSKNEYNSGSIVFAIKNLVNSPIEITMNSISINDYVTTIQSSTSAGDDFGYNTVFWNCDSDSSDLIGIQKVVIDMNLKYNEESFDTGSIDITKQVMSLIRAMIVDKAFVDDTNITNSIDNNIATN